MGSGHCPARPFLAPFEPLEEVQAKFLTLKALFLLAISSHKRIADVQALLVAPSCLEFAPGMVNAFLHPRPGYVPKVPANVVRSILSYSFSKCGPGKAQFALPSTGIRCLRPQSCPQPGVWRPPRP